MLVGVPKVWHIQTPVPGILQRDLWGLGPHCLLLQPPSTPHTQQQHSVLHLGGCVHIFTFYTLSTVVFSASWVHISPLQPGSEATGCVRVAPESLWHWLTDWAIGVGVGCRYLCKSYAGDLALPSGKGDWLIPTTYPCPWLCIYRNPWLFPVSFAIMRLMMAEISNFIFFIN